MQTENVICRRGQEDALFRRYRRNREPAVRDALSLGSCPWPRISHDATQAAGSQKTSRRLRPSRWSRRLVASTPIAVLP